MNNAAILLDDGVPIMSMAPELLAEHFAVNVVGAMGVIKAFLPGMLERGWGRVVMLSSEKGTIRGLASSAPAYSASKSALSAITVLVARTVHGTRRGKTFAQRLPSAAGVLDPYVRHYVADGKGGADWRPMRGVRTGW